YALELLRELRLALLSPDDAVYTAAISCCEKGGQWQKALQLLHEAQCEPRLKVSIITYNAAISACEKAGQWERSLRLLWGLQDAALAPDVVTYSAAISSLASSPSSASWSLALQLLRRSAGSEKRAARPNIVTFSAAMSVCGTSSQWERSLLLLRELQPGWKDFFPAWSP
ncbi:unnamed protein product, partial [Polarella glacialis]